MTPSSASKRSELRIDGMTCASCELLLERRLKALPGVKAVDADHRTGVVAITASRMPAKARIAAAVEEAGYALAGSGPAARADGGKWLEIGASLLVILALGKLLGAFDLVSLAPSTSGTLTLSGVFLIGLVAGMSSCLAVTGGLLLALAARHNERSRAVTAWERFVPTLRFNAGRLASYFVLGGAVGLIGQGLTPGVRATGVLNVAVALVMLWLALGILGLVPKSFPLRVPKALSRRVAAIADSDHPAAPFALGAMTFFLPCGFTQSLQLVALASGSAPAGAAIMLTFALGTLPALVGIGALSSAARGASSRLFLRFSGTLVLVLALLNLQSGLALTGVTMPGSSPSVATTAPAAGVQRVAMSVTPYGTYEPDVLTVRAGQPVEWTIDGTAATGCTSVITIPDLGLNQVLRAGPNVVAFTAPARPGPLAFMCSMGMVRGTFQVI